MAHSQQLQMNKHNKRHFGTSIETEGQLSLIRQATGASVSEIIRRAVAYYADNYDYEFRKPGKKRKP